MRALLDEQLPADLARSLPGHQVDTVASCGWAGVKNGELLRRASGNYDVFITMDRGIEYQQNLTTLTFAVLLLRAPSNRMRHLQPLIPEILATLPELGPGQFRSVGG
jgi:predicted nuclease of predicted toxin-antitoxin system